LIEADALDWLRTADRDWSEWRLVSNLPYSVASPILVDLALSARPPAALVATLQLEVVQRIAARPATPEYGVLTLLLGLRYEVTDWFKVPRDCFFPVPDVDSGCVILTRRAGPVVAPEVGKAFVEAVKRGFGQRRKMLRKLLAEQWGKEAVDRALTSAGVSLTERAERLTREQFLTLAEHLAA
jgi:16S rRNA (adenine1518-N6/adenine1519-N6)-dimethyltransferase